MRSIVKHVCTTHRRKIILIRYVLAVNCRSVKIAAGIRTTRENMVHEWMNSTHYQSCIIHKTDI